jgi:hypothetical protein
VNYVGFTVRDGDGLPTYIVEQKSASNIARKDPLFAALDQSDKATFFL